MSTILKALKKLEAEKRAVESPADLSDRVLASTADAHRKPAPAMWIGAGLAAGLLLAGGLVLLFGGQFTAPSPPSATVSGENPPGNPGQAPPPRPSTGAEPELPRSTALAGTVPPTAASAAADARPGGKAVNAGPDRKPLAAPTGMTSASPEVAPLGQVQLEHPQIPAPGQQWSAAYLQVSEILPASGGGRMAIVNGLPVMEGTMVEDATVKEILADRVLFSIDGKLVAVPRSSPP